MPKRSRAIPLSFPTVFFACLLLTTCSQAQNQPVFRSSELAANTPIRILQLLLENQQITPGMPAAACARNNAASVRPAHLSVPPVFLAENTTRPAPTNLLSPMASSQQRQITPAQYFGTGIQAAP